MRALVGDRDTLVTFQQRGEVIEGVYKTKSHTWADLASAPNELVEWQDMLPSRGERMADGINVNMKPARVRMLWRGDITNKMRVVNDGEPYEIVGGPSELGRKDGLEMVVQQVSTQGDAT